LRDEATAKQSELDAARKVYANASEERKSMMRQEILSYEQELENLQRQIRQKEKEERNKNYQIK
jgi:hypothetical protein